MRKRNPIGSVLGWLFEPIRRNPNFFVFMYLLGVISAVCTLPRNGELYNNLFVELFLDIYLVCVVLALIPRKVRFWLRIPLYILLYFTALADLYCFVSFDSTLNPSMLMLVGETNTREAGDFLSSCLSPNVIFSDVGWVLLLIVLHIALFFIHKIFLSHVRLRKEIVDVARPVLGFFTLVVIVLAVWLGWSNKVATHKLMTGSNIGEVEHILTDAHHAVLYTPVHRLAFSLYANSLAAKQIEVLFETAQKVTVDSCSYRSPQIVLIIGESFAKNHSQLYGYFKETTPWQVALQKTGLLVPFTDVVSCWNLTSFVFKNVFSTHVIGQKGEWCDYPLFPELFRKAGYHVTFLTNQYLPKAKQAVYDFSGGFFLNDPELSELQFDTRNTQLFTYDAQLLEDYDRNWRKEEGKHNLTIFHLIGQHVNYRQRYPREQSHFWASQYEEERPELSVRQRQVLSYYDNATLYNDSVVYQIIKRYSDQDAIVIYMPDHGEECYEENRGFICRNHSAEIDWPLAHYEFEVPFWIYCSHTYIKNHPEIYQQIVAARNRRYMTDALPHLLLYLAGIHTPWYQERYNILSPKYDEKRPRILKGKTDYDKLRDEHLRQKGKKL